jgi:hypothetical protein
MCCKIHSDQRPESASPESPFVFAPSLSSSPDSISTLLKNSTVARCRKQLNASFSNSLSLSTALITTEAPAAAVPVSQSSPALASATNALNYQSWIAIFADSQNWVQISAQISAICCVRDFHLHFCLAWAFELTVIHVFLLVWCIVWR